MYKNEFAFNTTFIARAENAKYVLEATIKNFFLNFINVRFVNVTRNSNYAFYIFSLKLLKKYCTSIA